MKTITAILLMLLLAGCKQTNWGALPFVEMNATKMVNGEHIELCRAKPNSVFCKNSPSIGDIQPTREYALDVLRKMNKNFKYKVDNTWNYNDTVHEYLKGDCEDIASTMAKHMIDDGIDKKYLAIAYREIENNYGHVFLVVQTSDEGRLHLDYENSGYPLEPRINFHMRMDDVGIHKWIKGNIK